MPGKKIILICIGSMVLASMSTLSLAYNLMQPEDLRAASWHRAANHPGRHPAQECLHRTPFFRFHQDVCLSGENRNRY